MIQYNLQYPPLCVGNVCKPARTITIITSVREGKNRVRLSAPETHKVQDNPSIMSRRWRYIKPMPMEQFLYPNSGHSGHYILRNMRERCQACECFTIIELAFFLHWLVSRRLLQDIGAAWRSIKHDPVEERQSTEDWSSME